MHHIKAMKITQRGAKLCTLIPVVLLAISLTAFAQFTFITNNGSITVTGYTGTNRTVVIPTNVTTIGDSAFYNRPLVGVIIPDSVTSIGSGSFWQCMNLTNAVFGNSLTNIGTSVDPVGAFGQTALRNVIVPNSVTTIGVLAFEACTSLANVTLGSGVTTIWEDAFIGSGLTSMTVPNSVTNIGVDSFLFCRGWKCFTFGTGLPAIPANFLYWGLRVCQHGPDQL